MKYVFLFCISFISCIYLHAQIVGATDFESQAFGTTYTKDIWQNDGFKTETWDNGLADRTMIDTATAVSGKKSLRISYLKGQFGPGPDGCQIALLFNPRNELYMSYWLKFSDNFSWF